MKCSECKYGIKKDNSWDCTLGLYCANDEDWNEHKCKKCVWSTWTGINYYCMLPSCKKGVKK